MLSFCDLFLPLMPTAPNTTNKNDHTRGRQCRYQAGYQQAKPRVVAFEWSPIERPGRSANTLVRIRAGRQRFGDRFVAPYYGSGSGETGRCLQRPLGTITTRDRWSVIDGDRMRMLSIPETKAAMGFPADYLLPANRREAMHLLGNAVCPPVACDVINAIRRAA